MAYTESTVKRLEILLDGIIDEQLKNKLVNAVGSDFRGRIDALFIKSRKGELLGEDLDMNTLFPTLSPDKKSAFIKVINDVYESKNPTSLAAYKKMGGYKRRNIKKTRSNRRRRSRRRN